MHPDDRSLLRIAALAAASVLLTSATTRPARAAALYWDGTDTTPNPDGGSGTWDLTTPNWDQGFSPNFTSTPWVQGSEAVFVGTPGAVTVAAPIEAQAIHVIASPTTITGGTITTPEVGAISGSTVIVQSSLQSPTSGFVVNTVGNSGTVVLNGDNSALPKNIDFGSGQGFLIVDGNQTPNRLPKNASLSQGPVSTVEIRGRDALPTGADAIDINSGFPFPETSTVLRVVSGASALSGAAVSHAHVRNLAYNGGTIELAYSGTGSAYNGESFQLNGDVTVQPNPTKFVYGPGANAANAGIALAGARTFNVFNNIRNSAFVTVAVELQDGDAGTAPGKLIANLGGGMSLDAANTYSGGTEVHATGFFGTLYATVNGALGTGDVTVASGTLSIGASDAVADRAFLFVNAGGRVSLSTGVNETVFGLVLDGGLQANGTYGSSTSTAQFKNDQFFSGTGIVTVVPEPGSFGAVAGLTALLSGRRRRRRRRLRAR